MLLIDPDDTLVYDFIDENEMIRNLGGTYTSRETTQPREDTLASSDETAAFRMMESQQNVSDSYSMN